MAAPIAVAWRAAIVGARVLRVRSGDVMRIVAALMFAVVAAVAQAASTEELFNEFGLFGTWAAQCQQAASPVNPHVSISSPSAGLVLESHDLGSDFAVNRYSVLAAERLSAERLSVQVIFQPGAEGEERQKLVFRIREGTRRTLFNQPDGGPARVKDGVAVGNRSRTPVLKKCE
jgi:hypothetical protein